MSTDLKEELAELLGDDDSFQAPSANCMYAEMGLSFSATPGAPPNDVLISFSCNQVQAHNFAWPHPNAGFKSETVQKLAQIVSQLFPPQAMAQPQPVAAGQSVPLVWL